ncbi:MAG: DUF2500 domain-containing protein [Lachnospiraceae bacterium]|nr:DUF2500 domain-containing protein [Lachnospiraceae bacterium]
MTNFFFGGGFEVVFSLMFFLVSGIILLTFIKGISQWNKNNHSPRLTVDATVVSKRMNVSHHNHVSADATGAHGYHTTTSTSYHVTFQVESGDRMELQVDGSEYGMLVEGDHGRLSFQGTRYIRFERV